MKKCQKCGVERASLHREHILPKWKGGSDDDSNIQRICANCHEDKTREDLRGFKHSEETKAKLSKLSKEYWSGGHSEETRAKLSAANKRAWANGKKASNNPEETSRRMSASLKKRWEDPEFRARVVAGISQPHKKNRSVENLFTQVEEAQ